MYNPNANNTKNPPPSAQNYNTIYNNNNNNNNNNHNNNYNYNYGQFNNNNAYDIAPPNNQKDYYYDSSNHAGGGGGGVLYDEFSLNDLSSTKIRHGFIRKVYSILSLQLLITFGFSLIAVTNSKVNEFLLKNFVLFFFLGMALSFPVLIYMVCYPAIARKYPINYFLLLIITIGMTFMVALSSAKVNTEIFFYSIGVTAAVVIALTIFSFQTKWDFTGWYIYLFMGFIILMVIGIIAIFVRNKVFNLVISGISAFFLSLCIIVDTQLIIGGKHKKFQFSIDDYIFATLTLYMDIVNLFLTILSILSNTE